MKRHSHWIAVFAVVFCAAGAARADVLNMSAGLTSLETVHIGDAGNAADTRYAASGAPYWGNDVGFGAVSYEYNIGKYEVTAGQYTEFLNAVAKTDTYGLYSVGMAPSNFFGCNIQRSGVSGSYTYTVASAWANRPVDWVTLWDACRFANWMNNGQPSGAQDATTTERGAYAFDGYNANDGSSIVRSTSAKWAVASEDEWYKAAYYKGGGTSAGYWDYPTQSDTAPSNVGADGYADLGNHANSSGASYTYTIGTPYYRTNVGEFENSASAYGTFDQGGNVSEWTEGLVAASGGEFRCMRGGGFVDNVGWLLASSRDYVAISGLMTEYASLGFRLVQIPEPCSLGMLAFGGLALLRRRK